jgi:hypothetical protein
MSIADMANRVCCAETQYPQYAWQDASRNCKGRTGRNCYAYRDHASCSAAASEGCQWNGSPYYGVCESTDITPQCWGMDIEAYCRQQPGCKWSDRHETCYNRKSYAKPIKCSGPVTRIRRDPIFVKDATKPSSHQDISRAWATFFDARGTPGSNRYHNRVDNNIHDCKKLMKDDSIQVRDSDVPKIWCRTRYALDAGCAVATPARYDRFCQ